MAQEKNQWETPFSTSSPKGGSWLGHGGQRSTVTCGRRPLDRLPASGELAGECLYPSLIEKEESIAVAFELCPDQGTQRCLGQLQQCRGQRKNRMDGMRGALRLFPQPTACFQG